MFDKIAIQQSRQFSDTEIEYLAQKNGLERCVFDTGKVVYSTSKRALNNVGYWLRIEKENDLCKVKFECSLHKIWNMYVNGLNELVNHNLFTFQNGYDTVLFLNLKTGLNLFEFRVKYFEIGVNLVLKHSFSEYLKDLQNVSYKNAANVETMYWERSVRAKTMKGTLQGENLRVEFIAYCKNQEMKDKGLQSVSRLNIARIEKKVSRVEKTYLKSLFDASKVLSLSSQFERDCKTMKFDRKQAINKIVGLSVNKKELLNDAWLYGVSAVLATAKQSLKAKEITAKQHRTMREFLERECETLLNELQPTAKELEFLKEVKRVISNSKVINY